MRNTRFGKLLFPVILILLLLLAACGGSDDSKGEKSDKTQKKEDGIYSKEDLDPTKTNEGEAIEGGTLNFGLVSDTAFDGTLNYNFYSGAPDVEVIDWFDEAL